MPKEPLVLLPGMMCDERVWRPQINYFAARADVFCADLTRHGNMEDMGRALLAELPWDRFSVAGLSMGGIVAMELLAQAPQRIIRCALLDTNYKAELPHRRLAREWQMDQARAGTLRSLIIEQMKPAYLSPRKTYAQDFLDIIVEMAMELGSDAFINQSLALRDRPDYTATLTAANCPILLLCGEDDKLCPIAYHQEMESLIDNPALRIIRDCGHISTLEQPQLVNWELDEWLAMAA